MNADQRPCPDCGVAPGERHQDGCDVARCKGCGSQALQCSVHASLPMTVWTGEWPGMAEVAKYGIGLNDQAMALASGDLVWDVDAEVLVPNVGDNALAIVGALVRIEPFAWSDDSGPICGLCGGFEVDVNGSAKVMHQPGCLLLRAERYARSLRTETT